MGYARLIVTIGRLRLTLLAKMIRSVPHAPAPIRSRSDGPVPVIFCVDVEPDEHTYDPDRPSAWRGFEILAVALRELRRELAKVTGEPARFCWAVRMDPQIDKAYGTPTWAVERYRQFFEEAFAEGDALGIHPHAWRWDEST